MKQDSPKEYDYFISHASEDKETFVRPLVHELKKMGYKVWYDEDTLKIGDSLFQEISDGIKNANYGIVVISKNFFKKEWTKKELNGLLSKEIFTSNKVILPIWLDITYDDVYNFSPILADKLSVSVKSSEIDKVISVLLKESNLEKINVNHINEKIEFLKTCNDDERKKYMIDVEARIKNLVYFQEAYYNWFCQDDVFGDEEWNDFLAEKKIREYQHKYNLPYNIEYNPEFHPKNGMDEIVKLAKKWVFRKASISEIYELIFLTDWYHEIDLPYILWGYPKDSTVDFETEELCFTGAFNIRLNNNITSSHIINGMVKTYKGYYGERADTEEVFAYILMGTQHRFIIDAFVKEKASK